MEAARRHLLARASIVANALQEAKELKPQQDEVNAELEVVNCSVFLAYRESHNILCS